MLTLVFFWVNFEHSEIKSAIESSFCPSSLKYLKITEISYLLSPA